MKKNQRTIKVNDDSHRIASYLSSKFGLSISGIIEILLHNAKAHDVLTIAPRVAAAKKRG